MIYSGSIVGYILSEVFFIVFSKYFFLLKSANNQYTIFGNHLKIFSMNKFFKMKSKLEKKKTFFFFIYSRIGMPKV